MLSCTKLKEIRSERSISLSQLAGHLAGGGFDKKNALGALKNWEKGLYKPTPSTEDVKKIANGLGVEATEISEWQSSCRYAPVSPTKARLVTKLIAGMDVQEALDTLKFTHKRTAHMVVKLIECAVGSAEENEANVDNLYISEARVDGAGRRIGTKTWIAKDRGRAHPIKKQACHIYITVRE
jgi:ribosomal protein L22